MFFFGPYIGFAGVVWTGRPTLEPLSTVLPMHFPPTDIEAEATLARHLGALKTAIHSLQEYYNALIMVGPSSTPFTFFYPTSYDEGGNRRHFSHLLQPSPNKLLFFAVLDENHEDICIKIVCSYSIEVHPFCAARGYAPAVKHFERIAGG
ncbi:hypothetical protein AX15_007889 [Amanita polypyramis BW_CC]|nr:hypothetical protein AX15_007889 [Amanita polypyramis BW_CC]